jgi:hypothetical protein
MYGRASVEERPRLVPLTTTSLVLALAERGDDLLSPDLAQSWTSMRKTPHYLTPCFTSITQVGIDRPDNEAQERGGYLLVPEEGGLPDQDCLLTG